MPIALGFRCVGALAEGESAERGLLGALGADVYLADSDSSPRDSLTHLPSKGARKSLSSAMKKMASRCGTVLTISSHKLPTYRISEKPDTPRRNATGMRCSAFSTPADAALKKGGVTFS